VSEEQAIQNGFVKLSDQGMARLQLRQYNRSLLKDLTRIQYSDINLMIRCTEQNFMVMFVQIKTAYLSSVHIWIYNMCIVHFIVATALRHDGSNH
jgi:hypothetical protein